MDIPDDVLDSARQMIGAFTNRFIEDHALPVGLAEQLFELLDFFYQEGWDDCDEYREWLKLEDGAGR